MQLPSGHSYCKMLLFIKHHPDHVTKQAHLLASTQDRHEERYTVNHEKQRIRLPNVMQVYDNWIHSTICHSCVIIFRCCACCFCPFEYGSLKCILKGRCARLYEYRYKLLDLNLHTQHGLVGSIISSSSAYVQYCVIAYSTIVHRPSAPPLKGQNRL